MTERDIHLMYKKETGFIPVVVEITGEISKKNCTLTFDIQDMPESYFEDKGNLSATFLIPDPKYIAWLEEKVKQLNEK